MDELKGTGGVTSHNTQVIVVGKFIILTCQYPVVTCQFSNFYLHFVSIVNLISKLFYNSIENKMLRIYLSIAHIIQFQFVICMEQYRISDYVNITDKDIMETKLLAKVEGCNQKVSHTGTQCFQCYLLVSNVVSQSVF